MDKLNPCQQCGGSIPVYGRWGTHTKNYQKRRFCGKPCASKHAGLNRGTEWRRKNSEAKMGEKNPHYGKPQTNPNSIAALHRQWEGHIKAVKVKSGKYNLPPEYKEEFKEYMRAVRYWSNKQDLSSLDNIEKRGVDWHLDHKYSIWDGFNAGVPIAMMSHINNLQMLPRKLNTAKGTKSCITLKELVCIARK